MKLKELLIGVKSIAIIGDTDVDITGVNIDSRKIHDGNLFVAMKGTLVDGHQFITKAISLGAKAILCEDLPTERSADVTYVRVADTENEVGKVATAFYDYPFKKLKLVGVK